MDSQKVCGSKEIGSTLSRSGIIKEVSKCDVIHGSSYWKSNTPRDLRDCSQEANEPRACLSDVPEITNRAARKKSDRYQGSDADSKWFPKKMAGLESTY
jgi:hypothetical protein